MTPTARDLPAVRLHYLDNIRSLVIVFVVLFHAVLPYSQACPWWYVVDPRSIPRAIFFMLLFELIPMPVLFFISGLMAWPTYGRRGPAHLIHMVPQVALQLLALSWPVPAMVKFAGVSLATLSISYLVSRLLVRKSTAGTILGLVLLFGAMGLLFR